MENKNSEDSESFYKVVSRKNEEIAKLKVEIENIKIESAEEISKMAENTNRSIMELKGIYEQEAPSRKSAGSTETYERLKNEFENMQEMIKNLEANEAKLKEQIFIKDERLEKITRTLRLKASESPKDVQYSTLLQQKELLSEKLIDKEIEISKLKKQIGDLKLEITYSACKPPIHSPKQPVNDIYQQIRVIISRALVFRKTRRVQTTKTIRKNDKQREFARMRVLL